MVSDRAEIGALSASLLNIARPDWMTLENLQPEMSLNEDFTEPPLPAFAGLVRCRSIYAAAAMEDASPGGFIQSCVETGSRPGYCPRCR